jgi:hypothetical protein
MENRIGEDGQGTQVRRSHASSNDADGTKCYTRFAPPGLNEHRNDLPESRIKLLEDAPVFPFRKGGRFASPLQKR